MSSDTEADAQKLKRLGRYLLGRPRMVLNFDYQHNISFLDSRVDTDHAGCIKTTRSTNCGALMFGNHCLKSWSMTQSIIALSSGETEYYGLVEGGSVLPGAISMAKDLGLNLRGRFHTDSSAAKGIASRRGLGKPGFFILITYGHKSGCIARTCNSLKSLPRITLEICSLNT